MGWASGGDVSQANVDSSADDPNLARSDFFGLIPYVNDMKNGRGTANGVAELDAGSLVPVSRLPAATESAIGAVERANQTETNAGVDNARYISPLRLAGWLGSTAITTLGTIATGVWNATTIAINKGGTGATTALAAFDALKQAATTAYQGVIELATQTEVNTGSDTTRAVVPSTLAGRTATETRSGLAELATQAEADAGTDDARIVTPLKLQKKPSLINAQTGTAYTVTTADVNKIVERNNAAANNTTIPNNTAQAIPVGSWVHIVQMGAGASTIVADSGVTIRSPESLVLEKQYAACSLYKRATNEWVMMGYLATA